MSTPPNVKLWLGFGGVSKLALSIPLAECGTFAIHPLKWLRFLGYAIYGRRGHLSTSKAGPEINDYMAHIEARSYYFIPLANGEPRLVDVDAMDDRTSDASDLTDRRADFRQRVIDRDGTCVVTGDVVHNCIPCHILPHSKGNNYISNVVQHRGEIYDSVDDLREIDDTRNGLLLNTTLHIPFGANQSAFLKTPNFGLTPDDIHYNPSRQADEESPASRLTLHHFIGLPRLGVVLHNIAPHNSDARQPQNTSDWPPAIIADLSYAAAALAAALAAWGSPSFKTYVRERLSAAYHDGNDNAMDNGAPGGGPDHAGVQMDDQTTERYSLCRRNQTPTARTSEPKERCSPDLMDGIRALWMQSSRVGQPQLEGARSEDVKKWLVQLTEESIM